MAHIQYQGATLPPSSPLLYPPETRKRGALSAPIRIRGNGLFGDCESIFYGIYDSAGAASFPMSKWVLKPLSAGAIFAEI